MYRLTCWMTAAPNQALLGNLRGRRDQASLFPNGQYRAALPDTLHAHSSREGSSATACQWAPKHLQQSYPLPRPPTTAPQCSAVEQTGCLAWAPMSPLLQPLGLIQSPLKKSLSPQHVSLTCPLPWELIFRSNLTASLLGCGGLEFITDNLGADNGLCCCTYLVLLGLLIRFDRPTLRKISDMIRWV